MATTEEEFTLGGEDPVGSYDAMDIGSAIQKLNDFGFFPDQIALVLDKPVHIVRTVISKKPAPEDRELADEIRRLCMTSIRRAFWMLDYGTGEQRMRIIMACLNGSTRMLSLAGQTSSEELRGDFMRLMNDMRSVPVRETIMTPDQGAIDVTASPVTPRTED